MIGADTSFLVDFFKDVPAAVAYAKKHEDDICACEHVVFEFLCGNLSDADQDLFLAVMEKIRVHPFTRAAAIKSASLYRVLKKKGESRPPSDVAIAGTYAANGVSSIVTRNGKHFEGIPGLKVESY